MDIVSAIDQAVGCHSCGGSLENSVSDLFCSEHCQQAWHGRQVGVAHLDPRRAVAEFNAAVERAVEGCSLLAEAIRSCEGSP